MLDINMEFRKGILFVRLNGILNNNTSKQLTKEIDNLIKEKGVKYFTFNLGGLEEITYEGIDTIKKNYQQIISFDGKLVLCGVQNEGIKTMLEDVYQSTTELGAFNLIRI